VQREGDHNGSEEPKIYAGRYIASARSHSISIPIELRKAMKIFRGDWFHMFLAGDVLIVVKVRPREAIRGMQLDMEKIKELTR